MTKKPRIKIEITVADKILEAAGWAVLMVIWATTAIYYSKLPNIIPIHFDSMGTADGFGNKAHILSLPVTASVLFIAMTILNRFPHLLNYPVKITEENAERQYKNMSLIIRFTQLALVIVFGIIEFQTIRYTDGLGVWLLPLICIIIFIPTVYFIVKPSNNRY